MHTQAHKLYCRSTTLYMHADSLAKSFSSELLNINKLTNLCLFQCQCSPVLRVSQQAKHWLIL